MSKDEEQVRLLSIFHYVVGGMAGLFASIPIGHLLIVLAIVLSPESFANGGEQPPAIIGWIFAVLGAVFITLGWIFAVTVIAAGRYLARRKCYLYCLVMGGVECLFMPFGTVLGVFTIIVLMRENVKGIFAVRGS